MARAIRLLRIGVRTAALAAALAVLPAAAEARVVVNERADVTGNAHNPCTDEVVVFTEGQMHTLVATGEDQSGGVRYHDHVNFTGVRGFGETTGDEYLVTYSTSFNQNATNGASTTTSGQTFQLVRTGSGDDYLLHAKTHITVTPDGEVAVESVHLSITCKG